jgi:tRNA (cmo5U34)-methyltransferase
MEHEDHDNRWAQDAHALQYLAFADGMGHRGEGEAELIRQLALQQRNRPIGRVLDLGCGDGRLLRLVQEAFPSVTGVAVDFNAVMLERARRCFADDAIDVVRHDLDTPLPELGSFDAVVSSFAIHHLSHRRKRALFSEIADVLRADGTFANLEHVASPTALLHERFREALGIADQPDDPSNILAPVQDQLDWLDAAGFVDVDCVWKWLEMALFVAIRPPTASLSTMRCARLG